MFQFPHLVNDYRRKQKHVAKRCGKWFLSVGYETEIEFLKLVSGSASEFHKMVIKKIGSLSCICNSPT